MEGRADTDLDPARVSLASLLVEPVTILHPGGGENRYHDIEKSWDDAMEEHVLGWMAQQSRSELTDAGREAEVSGWVLWLHPDATISGRDRVRWSGLTFDVDGAPHPALKPGKGVHHYEVPLQLVEG